MKDIKVAIIDDESHCIESLIIHLNDLFPELSVVYKTNNVQQAVEELGKLEIDLLFLDIEMPGMNGFQLLENFPNRSFDVIFTTAYSEYALQAFKARAISYLLKPIDEEELKETVSSWKVEREQQTAKIQDIDSLLQHLKREGFMKSKVAVPVTDGYEFIEVNRITYCQSQSNYTYIHLVDDHKLLVSKTLKEVERTLEKFFFMRIHQSYLINPNFMKKFSRRDGGFLVMKNGDNIPISRAKRNLVVNLFEAVQNKGS